DLIRKLGDDEALSTLDLFDLHDGALGDGAAARAVGVLDAAATQNRSPGGEVGTFDAQHELPQQLFAAGFRVLEVPLDAVGDLAQVVRWDAGGHPDRDAL